MLRLPALTERLTQEIEARQWFGVTWRGVVDAIIAQWQERGNIDLFRLTQALPTELGSEIAALALEGENLSDAECAKMADDCLAHLGRKYLETHKRDLRIAIRAAEEQKDEKAKRERMLEWQDLVRKERQLERRKREPKLIVR
jgi:hypothetical protein